MRHRFCLCGCALLLILCATGGIPTKRSMILAEVGLRLDMQGEQPLWADAEYLLKTYPKFREYRDDEDAPGRWYIAGSLIKHSLTGRYLAYDTTGKDPRLYSTKLPEKETTTWRITRHAKSSPSVPKGLIQADSGPFKDYYLGQKIEYDINNKITARFPLLVKDPTSTFAVTVYIHK